MSSFPDGAHKKTKIVVPIAATRWQLKLKMCFFVLCTFCLFCAAYGSHFAVHLMCVFIALVKLVVYYQFIVS